MKSVDSDRLTASEHIDFLASPWNYPKGQRESIIRAKRLRAAKKREGMMNAEKVMEVLRRVEWVGLPGEWPYCPACTSWRHKGHRDDCRLAALLSEGEKANQI